MNKIMKKIGVFKQNKQFSTVYVNHRNTIDNNEKTPFDFSIESYTKIDEILVLHYKKEKVS
jgi:hypothetical protein